MTSETMIRLKKYIVYKAKNKLKFPLNIAQPASLFPPIGLCYAATSVKESCKLNSVICIARVNIRVAN